VKQIHWDDAKIECDGHDLFVVLGGVKIARRGYPGTPQAKTWIPLEPGYQVISADDNSWTEIRYTEPTLQ
jgi:hypothetical protein